MLVTKLKSFTGHSTLKEISSAVVKVPNLRAENVQLFKVWQYNEGFPAGMLIASRCVFWMRPNLESMFSDIIN